MARLKLLPLCLALALAAPGAGLADPWKDESGRGRDRRERGWASRGDHRGERWDDRRERDHRGRGERRDGHRGDERRGYYGPPRIPSGHRPPPGEHRQWFPGLPPGHQPPPHRW